MFVSALIMLRKDFEGIDSSFDKILPDNTRKDCSLNFGKKKNDIRSNEILWRIKVFFEQNNIFSDTLFFKSQRQNYH